MQTIGNPHKYIYKVEDTGGRFGNVLFEYFFWRLLSMNNHKTFKNTLNVSDVGIVTDLKNTSNPSFPRPFNKLANYVHKDNQNILTPTLNKYSRDIVAPFPMNFKYYANYRNLLRSLLNKPDLLSKPIDIVVHIRLDNDVFSEDEPLYTILPISFYKNAIKTIQRKHGSLVNKKILIIGRPLTEAQKTIFNDIKECIKHESSSKYVYTQTGTISEDMTAMMSSKIMICAVSTFWFWPAYLSQTCNELHVPIFGQTKAYRFFNNIGSDFLKETRNLKLRITQENLSIYGYKINIKQKITIRTVENIYKY